MNVDNKYLKENWDRFWKESNEKKESEYQKPCLSPSHNPPTHLYIPAGEVYRHYCKSCGAEFIIRSSQPVW
jgi:hypothetical protein